MPWAPPPPVDTGPVNRTKGKSLALTRLSTNAEGLSVVEQLRAALTVSFGRVADLFRDMDEDQNGLVSKREFRMVLPVLGLKVSRDEADQFFDSIDEDASGEIDYRELQLQLRSGADVDLDAALQPGAAGRIVLESSNLIATRGGKLTDGGKLRGVVGSLSSTADAATIIADLKKALDQHLARVVDLFREWDEDGNGQVSKREFRRALSLLGLQADRVHVDALFEEIDVDSSGEVAYGELHHRLRKGIDAEAVQQRVAKRQVQSAGACTGPQRSSEEHAPLASRRLSHSASAAGRQQAGLKAAQALPALPPLPRELLAARKARATSASRCAITLARSETVFTCLSSLPVRPASAAVFAPARRRLQRLDQISCSLDRHMERRLEGKLARAKESAERTAQFRQRRGRHAEVEATRRPPQHQPSAKGGGHGCNPTVVAPNAAHDPHHGRSGMGPPAREEATEGGVQESDADAEAAARAAHTDTHAEDLPAHLRVDTSAASPLRPKGVRTNPADLLALGMHRLGAERAALYAQTVRSMLDDSHQQDGDDVRRESSSGAGEGEGRLSLEAWAAINPGEEALSAKQILACRHWQSAGSLKRISLPAAKAFRQAAADAPAGSGALPAVYADAAAAAAADFLRQKEAAAEAAITGSTAPAC